MEEDISKLTSKIDKAAAAPAGLREDVSHLQHGLSALAESQAKMDEIRRGSRAAGRARGTQSSSRLLRWHIRLSHVAEDDDMGEMMHQPAAPVKHARAGGAGRSNADALEVVESDFARNLAAEMTQELKAQSEYDETTQNTKEAPDLFDTGRSGETDSKELMVAVRAPAPDPRKDEIQETVSAVTTMEVAPSATRSS